MALILPTAFANINIAKTGKTGRLVSRMRGALGAALKRASSEKWFKEAGVQDSLCRPCWDRRRPYVVDSQTEKNVLMTASSGRGGILEYFLLRCRPRRSDGALRGLARLR